MENKFKNMGYVDKLYSSDISKFETQADENNWFHLRDINDFSYGIQYAAEIKIERGENGN